MVDVAQSVRASVCGTEGRGFEPHLLPRKKRNEGNFVPFLFLAHKGYKVHTKVHEETLCPLCVHSVLCELFFVNSIYEKHFPSHSACS